jgi:hypothetical protein
MKLKFRLATIRPYPFAQVRNIPVSIPKAYINLKSGEYTEQIFLSSLWTAEVFIDISINMEPDSIIYKLKKLL